MGLARTLLPEATKGCSPRSAHLTVTSPSGLPLHNHRRVECQWNGRLARRVHRRLAGGSKGGT